MIDKQTNIRGLISSSLPEKEELHVLKRLKEKCTGKWCDKTNHLVAKGLVGFIIAVVLAGFISLCVEYKYINIDEIIAASLLMPSKVLEWVRSIDIHAFVNKIYLPTMVLVVFIFLVAKLTKPKRD